MEQESLENAPQAFMQVLASAASPDNAMRKVAEVRLQVLMQNPFFADIAMATLTTCIPELRTMCAVLFAKYCRERTRMVRDACFQVAYGLYFQCQEAPVVNSLREALATVLANRLGDSSKVYFVCGLAIPAEDVQRVERKYELLSSTIKAIVGNFYRVGQMKVLFEQLSELLKNTVDKLRGRCLMLAIKSLKNIYKVYRPIIGHSVVLTWLRNIPHSDNCGEYQQTIWKDLLKLLVQVIIAGDLGVDALYQVFSNLRNVITNKQQRLPVPIIKLHIELYRSVYTRLQKNTSMQGELDSHVLLSTLVVHAREFVEWLLEMLQTDQQEDELLETISWALRVFWPSMDDQQVTDVVSKGIRMLGNNGYNQLLDLKTVVRRKVAVYYILDSTHEALHSRLNYEQLLVVVCSQEIPRCGNQTQLINACLRLINTHLTYTLQFHNIELKDLLLKTLIDLLLHVHHSDELLLQLCSAVIRLCRYALPTQYCREVAKISVQAIQRFDSQDSLMEYFQFLEDVPQGIWANIAGHLYSELLPLISQTLSQESSTSNELISRLIGIFTRAIDPNQFSPIYIGIIVKCRAENLCFAEPALQLLEKVCLQHGILESMELITVLRELGNVIVNQPKLLAVGCRVLMKILAVRLHIEQILKCVASVLCQLEAVYDEEKPLLAVVENLSIMLGQATATELLPLLIQLDRKQTSVILSNLIIRIILRSGDKKIGCYLPVKQDWNRLGMEWSDMKIMTWYLTAKQQQQQGENQVAALLNGLSLEQTMNKKSDSLQTLISCVQSQTNQLPRGQCIHWLYRYGGYGGVGPQRFAAVMRLIDDDHLWHRLLQEQH